jgi:hypothetical protein
VFGVETGVMLVVGCQCMFCLYTLRLLKPKEEIAQIGMDKCHGYWYGYGYKFSYPYP